MDLFSPVLFDTLGSNRLVPLDVLRTQWRVGWSKMVDRGITLCQNLMARRLLGHRVIVLLYGVQCCCPIHLLQVRQVHLYSVPVVDEVANGILTL